MGNAHTSLGDIKQGIKYYVIEDSLANVFKIWHERAKALYNIGWLYMNSSEYSKAEKYFIKSIKQAKKAHKIEYIHYNEHALGINYSRWGKYDKAIKYNDKALKYFKTIGNTLYTFDVLNNMAVLYFRKGDLNKAELFAKKALVTAKQLNRDNLIIGTYGTLIDIYIEMGKYNLAEKFLSLTLKDSAVFNHYGDHMNKENMYESAYMIYKNLKKYKKALQYLEKFDALKDSLFKKEKESSFAEIETKYQTAKKKKENALLKKQKAEQELEIARRKRQNLIYAGGLGISLLSLGIFFFFYRKNLKQKQMILNLQRELHHRIKNNLRVITAFINSIKEKFENKEKVDVQEINEQLNELEKRVQTIYNLHKQLYEGAKVTHLDLDKYIKLLTETIAANYDQAVETELDIPEGTSIKADNSIILGLILTELTINAFKHAFRKAGGRIKIKINVSSTKKS